MYSCEKLILTSFLYNFIGCGDMYQTELFSFRYLKHYNNEINIMIVNESYLIGISPDGLYRWEKDPSSSSFVDHDDRYRIKIRGVDLV